MEPLSKEVQEQDILPSKINTYILSIIFRTICLSWITALESQDDDPFGFSKLLLEFSFLFFKSAENMENATTGISSLQTYPANPLI